MGYQLALAAYEIANTAGIAHAPTRLFVFMSVTASDDDTTPVFFGGRERLAAALGVDTDTNGYRAVERAIHALRKAHVIDVAAKGAPGRNSRYLLQNGKGSPLAANTPRSASGDDATPDVKRPVNNPEHPTLSGRTPDVERYEHPTLSVGQKERKELRKGEPPSRFCSRHPRGTGGVPCGACADARRAAEAWKPPKPPKRVHIHSFDPVSGYCSGCEQREDRQIA